MMATYSDGNSVRVQGLFTKQAGYTTPKVDVRWVVIEHGVHSTVARNLLESWTMPGGWADVNPSPSECVIREPREETGLEVTVRKLAAVYDRARQGHPPHPFHVYRLCDVVRGTPEVGLETSDVALFYENLGL
jgi:ADP-ribose pyrophosphatase YjhB (NUDIX family)